MPLDWLAEAGLAPAVHARLVALEGALWEGAIDPRLLRLVRARTAQLVGDAVDPADDAYAELARRWTTAPELDDRDRTVLRWAEQFVIDPHGISDAEVSALVEVLDARRCAELTTAIAVFEGLARTRVALAGEGV